MQNEFKKATIGKKICIVSIIVMVVSFPLMALDDSAFAIGGLGFLGFVIGFVLHLISAIFTWSKSRSPQSSLLGALKSILVIILVLLGLLAVAKIGQGYRYISDPEKYLQELEYEKNPIDCNKYPDNDRCIMDAYRNSRPEPAY